MTDWLSLVINGCFTLAGVALGWYASSRVEASAFKREQNTRAKERREELEERRLRILSGLLAEVQENLAATPWDVRQLKSVYVRDMWRGVKDQLAFLPDEVLDATRDAYAKAARFNGLVAYARSVPGRSIAFDGYLSDVGKEVDDAFRAAETVLAYHLHGRQDALRTDPNL